MMNYSEQLILSGSFSLQTYPKSYNCEFGIYFVQTGIDHFKVFVRHKSPEMAGITGHLDATFYYDIDVGYEDEGSSGSGIVYHTDIEVSADETDDVILDYGLPYYVKRIRVKFYTLKFTVDDTVKYTAAGTTAVCSMKKNATAMVSDGTAYREYEIYVSTGSEFVPVQAYCSNGTEWEELS